MPSLRAVRPSAAFVLFTLSWAVLSACAEGSDATGAGGTLASASTSASTSDASTSVASTTATGTGGVGGGTGGTGGGLSGSIDLCVLNEGGPQDPCIQPPELDYGVVPSGTTELRTFRIDNGTAADVLFTSATINSNHFTVEPVRFEVDPGDPNAFLRVPVTLPFSRMPGQSIWFEVSYTSTGNAGQIPPDAVTVKMNTNGTALPNIDVPVIGSESGCPDGLGACDADPNNGCETNTDTSNQYCGSCFTPCDPTGGTGQCVDGVCTLTGCDPLAANCNMMDSDGCEVNLLNDPMHCGSCTNNCNKANTMSVCAGGNCNITLCLNNHADCNLMASDGCETNLANDMNHCGGCNQKCDLAHAGESCVTSMVTGLGVCTLGLCDPGFKNCDLMPGDGCEVDSQNDVNNCNNCFNICTFNNAAESCVAGMCTMGQCDMGFGNCNGFLADGCEVNLTQDKDHCGVCTTDCDVTFPNSQVSCNASTCQFNGCAAGFYNLDGNTANGCEYACTFVSATDLPDNGFVDANCDGIDGSVANSIFVSPSGSDSNPGTMTQPVQTLAVAITRAQTAGKTVILASNGSYGARLNLANGISIYGGYSQSNGWARSNAFIATISSSATTGGHVAAVEGSGITQPTVLDRFTITAGSTNAAGTSTYGVYCSGCTGLTISNSNISAGSGGNGNAGSGGANGTAGNGGTVGSGVDCDTNGSGGLGGGGGTNASCSRTGGNGGQGGSSSPGSGQTGGQGVSMVAGGTGGGGGDPGGTGNGGANGPAGSNGSNGSGGSGGSVVSGFWASTNGTNGVAGTHGNGGGGGGGGGGQGCGICDNGQGNGGGGGGAGGCAGLSGGLGSGGGGSFGVFLVNSTGIALTNNTISSGNGGNGGAGGTGGTGGAGGAGAAGGMVCTSEVGGGGKGGNGGAGGNGGSGGGGAGGPSYGVYRSGTVVNTSGNTLSHGNGGSGGPSAGNAGAVGASADLF